MRLVARLLRPTTLNIKLSQAKSELMHLVPMDFTRSNHVGARGITLYSNAIEPQKIIRSLGVWIEYNLYV